MSNREPGMPQKVPWRALVDHGVVLNHDRSLLRTYRLRGPDLAAASEDTQGSIMWQLNNTFKRLGGSFALHDEAQRRRVTTYPELAWPHPVPAFVDRVRRQAILAAPTFETSYYLTLRWRMPSRLSGWFARWLLTNPPRAVSARGIPADVERFREQADHLAHLLRGVLAVCEPLTSQELLTYLHSTVSDRRHRIAVPRDRTRLNHDLCDAVLVGGWFPKLGEHHLRLCSVTNYPETSIAPALARMDHLPFEFRRVGRLIVWEKVVARGVFRRTQHAWLAQEKTPLQLALEQKGHVARVIDTHATNRAEDADAARQEVSGGYVGYGHYTCVAAVLDATPDGADDKIAAVRQIFEDEGFTVIIEKPHSRLAFHSAVAGNIADSVRRKPMSTLNVAHWSAGMKAAWPGQQWDEVLQAGPHYLAHTEGSTLFSVVNHVNRVGHKLVLGPTGCHAKGTTILMADGSLKSVEDIVPGDQVMGPDSLPRTVTALHRGTGEMVRIVPTKGEPFEVNMDHVLSLKRTGDRTALAGTVIDLTVREWLGRSRTFRHVHKLYRTGVEFPASGSLPLDPYVLGVLLGDGSLTRNHPTVSNPDPEIRETIETRGPIGGFAVHSVHGGEGGCPTYSLVNAPGTRVRRLVTKRSRHGLVYTRPYKVNPVKEALTALGLAGVDASRKCIPPPYKTVGKENRLQILAGLLDTDGSLSCGGYDYVSKSPALAADVAFLARSLGLAAYLSPCEKSCQGDFSGQYFRVSISGETSIIPCRVVRKQALPRRQKKSVLVTGFTVETVGVGDYYGFECDGDHRYLMGDFTVTHNSGKTSLLDFESLQWPRYWPCQVFRFAIGGGEEPITRSLDGAYYDLGTDRVSHQPYRLIHQPEEFAFYYEWTLDRLVEAGIPLTDTTRSFTRKGLEHLTREPMAKRTMTQLVYLLTDVNRRVQEGAQNPSLPYASQLKAEAEHHRHIIRALRDLTGGRLDGDHDDLATGWFHTFEQETLLTLKRLAPGIMSHLFHQIERRLDGRPTLIEMDEATLPMVIPDYANELPAWAMTKRKQNVSLTISMPLVTLLDQEVLRPLLVQSCPTIIATPNPAAMGRDVFAVYEAMGFHDTMIQTIAVGRPGYEYVYKSPYGFRCFQLDLGGVLSAFCGSSNAPEDQRMIQAILEEPGHERFVVRWLRAKGYGAEADALAKDLEVWDRTHRGVLESSAV